MPTTPIFIPAGVLADPLDADDVIRVDRSGKTMYTRVEEFASDPAFASQYAPLRGREVFWGPMLDVGAGSPAFTYTAKFASWRLDPTTNEGVGMLYTCPYGWIGETVDVSVLIANPLGTAVTGTSVVLRLDHWNHFENSGIAGTNGTTTSETAVTEAMDGLNLAETRWVDLGSITAASGGQFLRATRVANDAADTFTTDVGIVALRVTLPFP